MEEEELQNPTKSKPRYLS